MEEPGNTEGMTSFFWSLDQWPLSWVLLALLTKMAEVAAPSCPGQAVVLFPGQLSFPYTRVDRRTPLRSICYPHLAPAQEVHSGGPQPLSWLWIAVWILPSQNLSSNGNLPNQHGNSEQLEKAKSFPQDYLYLSDVPLHSQGRGVV